MISLKKQQKTTKMGHFSNLKVKKTQTRQQQKGILLNSYKKHLWRLNKQKTQNFFAKQPKT